ncbi:MAG: methyltransferase domain-containing protein, partial [Planctomycetes bacterium]|nr:methyltransferase domain-containing protein [Planctomycetota bacterium]
MSNENESPTALAGLVETPVEEQEFASLQDGPVTAIATTEIDVKEVVESFRDSAIAVTDELGFDRIVRWVKNDEAALVTMQACPVCDGTQGQPIYAIEGLPFRVVLCIDCQTGQLHPQATPEQIRAFYPPEYYGSTGAKFESVVEAFVKIVGARHVRSLTRGIPEGGKVLDVGCGRGVVLGALADREFEVHGFEISQTAAEGADPRAHIRIADDLTQARYLTDCFDQVILWHVLEH